MGSNPASPTTRNRKPFGELVKRLSLFHDHSCVAEHAIDPLARDQRPAVLAGEESPGERHADLRRRAAMSLLGQLCDAVPRTAATNPARRYAV